MINRSFPPLLGQNAGILILGSMPGIASLKAQQYYAHPRNVFWKIIEALYADKPTVNYLEKTQLISEIGIALWDVLECCEREGSLDSNIKSATEIPNDIVGLLNAEPSIKRICFNGQKAFVSFKKHFLLTGEIDSARIDLVPMPSTSPAHASLSYEKKLVQWREGLVF